MGEPLFSSSRSALFFALSNRPYMPRPAMAKAADEAKLKQIQLADGTKVMVKVSRGRAKDPQLMGMDGLATSGMILQQLSRLKDPEQLCLICGVLPPTVPCNCGAACCGGRRPDPDWIRAVDALCVYLREEAKLSKVRGKKGLSTDPRLRQDLVIKHFSGGEVSTQSIAFRHGITSTTVLHHGHRIAQYLEKMTNSGWSEFDTVINESGIVGTIT